MSWLVHHTRSEEYASQAEELHRQQDLNRAAGLYRLSAEAEVNALNNLDSSKTRTIGITAVSAASLYFKAQEFLQAKRVAHKWLATELLPPFAVEELEDLLQTIRYEESRAKSGIQFIEGKVLVSVRGGEVLYGAAPLDLVLRKVDQIRNMLYRTTELLLDIPFRTGRPPTQDVKDQCDPWVFQAAPGSYQFEVRVRKPKNFEQLKLSFPGMSDSDAKLRVEQITQKFLEVIRATSQDPEGELTEVVPNEEYRGAFLKLTRELAPPLTGKSFNEIEIKSISDAEFRPVILVPNTREAIKNVLKKSEPELPELPEYKVTQLRGTLRGLQLDDDWVEIRIDGENQKNQKVYGAKEEIDDVVGPMVNRRVVAEVIERGDRSVEKRYSLRDLQLEEDTL
ncbi:MAG: hypothetical protein KME15_06865 [Drouetiella hepatica Uher 2000/2452]|jgi:hypothetical protein|uniref:Uncharacterized protein n=1 Tax=Drouetiella hepatica Uher 2000/2452 TaxID=904376 RepID=A0A951Q7W0_9CYAN|nr:hypothetical protein [Drouetiella hepatica Uher 2000/2452]